MSYGRPLFWATAVLTGGVAASLAGNLQAINLDNANPGIGEHISAAWWPLSLFAVAELLIHTPWLATWRDHLTKLATVTLVAAVAAWVSYWHLANVLSHYGYDVASRYAGPVAIDAAMVLATLAMDRIGQARRMAKAVDKPMANVKASEGWTDWMDKAVVDTEPVSTVNAPTPLDVDNALANGFVQLDIPADKMPFAREADVSTVLDKGAVRPVDSWTLDTADVHDWTERLANLEPVSTPLDSEEDIFARLEREMTNRPPLGPADIPVSPAPAGRARSGRMTAEQGAQALEYARIGREHGLKAGEVADALAAWAGVSTRTIRRLPWWTALMEGSQAS